jgi:hypothetical protein
MTLGVFGPRESRELFSKYLGQRRLNAEPEAVDALIEHCAGLPLTLAIVAARAERAPGLLLEDIATELRAEHQRLEELDVREDTKVWAVFSRSYHALSPPAARLFRLLSLPPRPDITLAAAADLAGISEQQARTLFDELVRANLVEQPYPDRYNLHELLRAYAAECAAQDETEDDRRAALRRLSDH